MKLPHGGDTERPVKPGQRCSGFTVLAHSPSLEENSRKKRNILEAIELRKVGSPVATLVDRLEELGTEAQDLDQTLRIVSMGHARRSQLTNNVDAVAEFMSGFEHHFENAPPHEKKLLMRKCISRIVVDRDEGTINVGICLVPAATPAIEALYKNRAALTTEVVSAASSGDRT